MSSARPEHESVAAEPAVATAERAAASALTALDPATGAREGLPATLLSLQRTAGNRAVGRLLRRRGLTGGVAQGPAGRRTLLRRRVPDPAALEDILTDPNPAGAGRVDAPDAAAHQAGLDRLLADATRGLSPADQARVTSLMLAGRTQAQFQALPHWQQEIASAQAIVAVDPARQLGDPALIDIGPRPGTPDAANIQTLVDNANAVFATIASGANDSDLRQVFGAANVREAKRRYANARSWMNQLHASNHIVTDRSGYNREVDLGGLTGFHVQIALEPGTIDNPSANESVVTMIHESTHAGNRDVGDHGYIGQPSFKELSASIKLRNAAHFEVVPRRILGASDSYAGETFTPAGSTGPGGARTPRLTPRQQAVREASELFREAWTTGLNLHSLFVEVWRNPTEWNTLDLRPRFGLAAGTHFADVLPFWSKVEKMTIHDRTQINPTGGNESTAPVTLIDVALSEGVVRKLAKAMTETPRDDGVALAMEATYATGAEMAAATTMAAERDLIIKIVLRNEVGSITGNVDRDIRAVNAMGRVGDEWTSILQTRPPSAFVD